MAEYYDMKDKMRRSAQDEQTARFKAATGNDPYAAEIIAGESRVAAPPRAAAPEAAPMARSVAPVAAAAPKPPKARPSGVAPKGMASGSYGGAPSMESRPSGFRAREYQPALEELMIGNGMSPKDASATAQRIVDTYNRTGDKSVRMLMKNVAYLRQAEGEQMRKSLTDADVVDARFKSRMALGALLGAAGAAGALTGGAAFPAVAGVTLGALSGALGGEAAGIGQAAGEIAVDAATTPTPRFRTR